MTEQKSMKKTERETSADVIRITAFAAVLGVHFFLNTEYYIRPVAGIRMYLMTIVRTMCMVCVPMFMLLTGYLESRKEIALTKAALWRFYRKLIGVWLVYLLAAIVKLIFRCVYMPNRQGRNERF